MLIPTDGTEPFAVAIQPAIASWSPAGPGSSGGTTVQVRPDGRVVGRLLRLDPIAKDDRGQSVAGVKLAIQEAGEGAGAFHRNYQ